MMTALSITEAQIFTALGGVLTGFGMVASDGSAVPVIRGQVNRVPQPTSPDHVVMWPLMRTRLATNVDTVIDAHFTGSITANVLTVAALLTGSPAIGQKLYAHGITAGCTILTQITGSPGGVGTYTVSQTANVASTTIYCGSLFLEQDTEFTAQIDVHGPASADNIARISTIWRDQACVDLFTANGGFVCPLYHSDPRQLPFENAENQVEERWSIDLAMQVNPVITLPMQFAGTLVAATPIPVATVSP